MRDLTTFKLIANCQNASPRLREFAEPEEAGLLHTPYWLHASLTAFSMNSLVILLDGLSLKIEFMRAILAALRRASAFVGQAFKK